MSELALIIIGFIAFKPRNQPCNTCGRLTMHPLEKAFDKYCYKCHPDWRDKLVN